MAATVALTEVDSDVAIKMTVGAIIEIDCQLEAPVLATHLISGIPIDASLPNVTVRLGTTRGTNALLTRAGDPPSELPPATTITVDDRLRIETPGGGGWGAAQR